MNGETINEGETTIKDRVSPRRIGTVNIVLLVIPYRNSGLKTRVCSPRACACIYTHTCTYKFVRARGDLSPGLDFIGRNGQKFGDRYHRSDSWYPGNGGMGKPSGMREKKGEE